MHLGQLTFDAADAHGLAAWWAELLGWNTEPGPDLGEVRVVPPDGEGVPLMFLRVPEPKRAKNRFHPDLHTANLDEDVARAVALGAAELARHKETSRWAVLQDPEGNEFCIVERRRQ